MADASEKLTRRQRRKARRAPDPTAERPVVLGNVAVNGVAASMVAQLDRGMIRRPHIGRSMSGRVEFHFEGDFAPIRVVFGPEAILVDDIGEPAVPGRRRRVLDEPPGPPVDLVIRGPLPAVVQLASSPLLGGLPNPVTSRGRKAIRDLTSGAVRFDGDRTLARRLLKLLEI